MHCNAHGVHLLHLIVKAHPYVVRVRATGGSFTLLPPCSEPEVEMVLAKPQEDGACGCHLIRGGVIDETLAGHCFVV